MRKSEHYGIALGDVMSPFAAFRPPTKMTVAEGVARNLVIKQPGGAAANWSPDEAPYMVEPMNMLASRRHEAVCFVGPARTGKTVGLITGWMTHAVVNDPGDMLIVQMSQEKARDFSKTDIDRALRHSPELAGMKSQSLQHDNTHDKLFRHGMWLKIAWPTISNLSGSTYRYVAFTDYDRMPDDIDGEGAPYPLGLKRTQTFLSRGMCLTESSPGRPLTDPQWTPATPHEAPPAAGILSIYNSSDRRRWYWQCPDCDEWFEAAPGLALFNLPPEDDLLQIVREANLEALASEYSRVVCPACGAVHAHSMKRKLNAGGRWLRDGQRLTPDGEIVGDGMTSSIAGYWLGGVAAAYQSWKSIVLRYLQGLREYALTGDEQTLQTTVNTDQGMPYMSRLLAEAAKNASDPAGRKDAALLRYVVPDEARFVVAAVDVQGGTNARFVVQVYAVGPNLEQWPIDRYEIRESMREGMGSNAPVDPAAYDEDWDLLTDRVVRATYRTAVEGQELRVRMAAVDSGGEAGVTDKAYAWYRRVRREGLGDRVMLVKGASTRNAPMIKQTMVGGRNKDDKGDIPLYLLNTNLLKDAVSTGLKRPKPGPNFIHMPSWLPAAFFDELNAEVRNANGSWSQIRKRNEAFDLSGYIRAACLRLGADKMRWDAAPPWARPLMENSDRITREDRREVQGNTRIATAPAEPARRTARRRVSHSSYLA